jgi:hypothetical protein
MNERFLQRQQAFRIIYVSSILHIFTTVLLNMILLEETASLHDEGQRGDIYLITIRVIQH